MTKVRKRGARGPGAPARARGRRGGAGRPGCCSGDPAPPPPGRRRARAGPRYLGVAVPSRPRPAPAALIFLPLRRKLPGRPRPGPEAALRPLRAGSPSPDPPRASVSPGLGERQTPRRFCFPVRVPFSRPALAFSGADALGVRRKQLVYVKANAPHAGPRRHPPFPSARRLQKWRLCPDPDQVTTGRQVCPWGLDRKAQGDVVCASDFPTYGQFRAACWAQGDRGGGRSKETAKPRAGCWRLGLMG